MKRIEVKQIFSLPLDSSIILVKGWVKAFRSGRFIALNDGSTVKNIQVVIPDSLTNELVQRISVGACIAVKGCLSASVGKGQTVELQAESLEVLGDCDASTFPIQPKKHSFEFLRENAHLRWRTNTFAAVFRIRHSLAFAIHEYFNKNGFFYVHTPIITGSDCEGAGEMFHVSTLDPKNPPLNTDGSIDYKQDFFGKETNLTVSGQLQGETAALALGKIYTFGPTFRAENSNTSRHLAEFWMIEPEVAFNDLTDNMDLAEDMLKYLIRYVLTHCNDDLDFLNERLKEEENAKKQNERQSMNLLEKLDFCIQNDFIRLTYTEAVEILKNSDYNKKGKFQYPITHWGCDLQSEHERYLVEKHFKRPVILTNYPAEIKAFYMRQDEPLPNVPAATVSAMDILFPAIGEIIGGSQREERLNLLQKRMEEMHIPQDDLSWYLDTRRFGSCPHAGFGLGFERLVLFVTGMSNIRDVIPFPRTPKSAAF
jgi:asparaginyl-tRNA synthetase